MRKISRFIISLLITISLLLATACDASTSNMTIPAVNETDIDEAAETLGVSTDDLTAYLNSLDTSFDEYIKNMNNNNQTLSDFKTKIETNYNCTFKEYVDTIVLVNNKTIPDENEYTAFKSKYSVFDVYIPSEELDGNTLINFGVSVEIADDADDTAAFDVLQTCSGDLRRYMDLINQAYGCKSVETTNIAMFGGHGVTKPDADNPCMDNFFVYDSDTNEILEQLTVSVLILHYDDENENKAFALCNEIGLLFKASGSDCDQKILKLSELKFQVRTANN